LSAFSAICLVAFLGYAFLGFYVLVLDIRARVNRLFFAASSAFALWALAYVIAHSADTVELYAAAYRISSPFWIGCTPIAFHFFVAMMRPAWLVRYRWLPVVLYAPAIVLDWRELTSGLFAAEFVRTRLGWYEVPHFESPWFWVLVGYYQLTAWGSMALAWRWGATSTRKSDKTQSRVIFAGGVVSLLGVTLDNLGWPGLASEPVPSVAPALMVFWFAAMAWGLVRYRFMAITPSAVAPVLLRTMDETVLLLDETWRVLTVNEASRALLGLDAAELSGRPLASLFKRAPGDEAFFADLSAHARGTRREMTCLTGDGREVPVMLSLSPLKTEGAVVVLRDISEAKRTEAQLRHMAQHDALTGLTNRYVFHDRLLHAIELARRAHNRLAVVVLDLDRFKQVNDTHGHEAGDALLKEVATRLTSHLRKSDTVSRMGGDEFAIILPDLEEPAALDVATARVVQACKGSVRTGAHELPIESSIGVSVFPEDGDTPDELVRRADLAMYEAKRSRAQVAFARALPQPPVPAKD
jgi:diguanylate cyclase (GGDEF)-like protein/PAS domain S-box-containing protein